MPLIYWFSRRMTLWGSISFNLAVFINIIIAFFYPYVEGASTGEDTSGQASARQAPMPRTRIRQMAKAAMRQALKPDALPAPSTPRLIRRHGAED